MENFQSPGGQQYDSDHPGLAGSSCPLAYFPIPYLLASFLFQKKNMWMFGRGKQCKFFQILAAMLATCGHWR